MCWQCVHNHPIMIKIHPVFFCNLVKCFPLSQIEPYAHVTSHGWRPLPQLLIDSSVLAQTALVSYLRPALSELSSVVSLLEQMYTRMSPKRMRCFVVGCNNENSSHLLPSSERLKRIMFGSEENAPSIYLNTSMFEQIIRDPASPYRSSEYKIF